MTLVILLKEEGGAGVTVNKIVNLTIICKKSCQTVTFVKKCRSKIIDEKLVKVEG